MTTVVFDLLPYIQNNDLLGVHHFFGHFLIDLLVGGISRISSATEWGATGVSFFSFESLQKSDGKCLVALFRKVYAIIGQSNAPRSGVDKASAYSFRQGPTEFGKDTGVFNELLVWPLCAQGHWRRCNQ